MTRQASSIIGSGTYPYTRQILPIAQRGANDNGGGIRTGNQVVIANPEDLTSVDAFAVSGITVGTTPVQILAPGNNPLPRSVKVILQNVGSQDVFIGPTSEKASVAEGFVLATDGTAGTSRRVELPFLHNVEIWARSQTGTSTIKMLIY